MNNTFHHLLAKFQEEFSGIHCTLMEVCGTHTNAIRKAGIHQMLPEGIRLLSGPGCPVCVTGSGYIEQVIQLSRKPNVIIATFGDLLKVPGNQGTLTEARANGGQIRIVYSPLDAIQIARTHPGHEVIFLGVGFETTAPVIALVVKEAFQTRCENFSVLPALKILNPVLRVLLNDPQLKIDGLIAPGHLSVITGARALSFLPLEYHLPTVITGFQTEEIWLGLWALMKQIKSGDARLENQYPKAVSWEGNLAAQKLIQEIFASETTEWRGMGMVENSGLGFQEPYQKFDARKRFRLEEIISDEPPCCLCGLILTGKAEPEECSHFGRSCIPERPVGPCMVSSEGACAAHFNYQKWTSDKL